MKNKIYEPGYFLYAIFIMISLLIYPMNVSAQEITLNQTNVYLAPHESCTLKLLSGNGKITWQSSNKKTATVSESGEIKGKKKGSCYITADYLGQQYTCIVHVANVSYYKNSKSKAIYRYKDGSKITLYTGKYKGKGGKAKYYAAHVQLKNISYNKMGLAKANGRRSNGFQSVLSAVRTKNNAAYKAVLAVNGPFNGSDNPHWTHSGGYWSGIYSHDYNEIVGGTYYAGQIGSNKVSDCATYCNRTGILAPGTSQANVTAVTNLSDAAEYGYITDTFGGDMGITLLMNGNILEDFRSTSYRQRTFIGTNGSPGDFWIVVSNGQNSDGSRYDRYSKGINMYGAGSILKSLGCTYGYNLDGGGSSTMVFKGKIVTKNWSGGGRPCYDMLYVRR